MDRVIEANKYSQVIHGYLKEFKHTQTHKDGISVNVNNNYTELIKYRPENGYDAIPTKGSKYRFLIPREYGFLKNMYLRTVVRTPTVGPGIRQSLQGGGLLMYSDIRFKQNALDISRITRSYNICRLNELPDDQWNQINGTASINWQPLGMFDETTVCTPLFMYFTDQTNNNLMLNLHKQLQLDIMWAGLEMLTPISYFSVELCVVTENFEIDYLANYIANAVQRDWFGRDIITLQNHEPGTSRQTIFYPRMEATCNAMMTGCILDSGNLLTITSMDIYLSSNLLQSISKADLVYMDQMTDQESPVMSYYWGSMKRDGFYGGLDLSQGMLSVVVHYDNPDNEPVLIELNMENYKIFKSNDKGVLTSDQLMH